MKPKPPPGLKVCCLNCTRLVSFGYIEGPTPADNCHLVSCSYGMPCPRATPCHYSFGSQVPGCAPCPLFISGTPKRIKDDGKHMEDPADLPGDRPTML
jgi:hypothetical protein